MPDIVLGLTGSQRSALRAVKQRYTYANSTIPAGNTVTAQAEVAWETKATVPAGTLVPGSVIRIRQGGQYSSSGVAPSITPRIRLGGVVLVGRSVTGLLGSANSPWEADAEFVVTSSGIVGGGVLFIADDINRIIRAMSPIAGINYAGPLDLTASAQWGQAGCSITCNEFVVEVM